MWTERCRRMHSITWGPKQCSVAKTYLVRLESGDFAETKKMVLSRNSIFGRLGISAKFSGSRTGKFLPITKPSAFPRPGFPATSQSPEASEGPAASRTRCWHRCAGSSCSARSRRRPPVGHAGAHSTIAAVAGAAIGIGAELGAAGNAYAQAGHAIPPLHFPELHCESSLQEPPFGTGAHLWSWAPLPEQHRASFSKGTMFPFGAQAMLIGQTWDTVALAWSTTVIVGKKN